MIVIPLMWVLVGHLATKDIHLHSLVKCLTIQKRTIQLMILNFIVLFKHYDIGDLTYLIQREFILDFDHEALKHMNS